MPQATADSQGPEMGGGGAAAAILSRQRPVKVLVELVLVWFVCSGVAMATITDRCS